MKLISKLKMASLFVGLLFWEIQSFAQVKDAPAAEVMAAEVDVNTPSIFERAWDSGFVIFSVLFIFNSIFCFKLGNLYYKIFVFKKTECNKSELCEKVLGFKIFK